MNRQQTTLVWRRTGTRSVKITRFRLCSPQTTTLFFSFSFSALFAKSSTQTISQPRPTTSDMTNETRRKRQNPKPTRGNTGHLGRGGGRGARKSAERSLLKTNRYKTETRSLRRKAHTTNWFYFCCVDVCLIGTFRTRGRGFLFLVDGLEGAGVVMRALLYLCWPALNGRIGSRCHGSIRGRIAS